MAGAGAIGGWLGAHLAAAHDVVLLGRQALADAVGADGLHVTGSSDLHVRVPVVTSPTGGPFDVVFVTCKAHATAKVAADVAPLLAPDGSMVTLQNGLGNAEVLAEHVGPERVVVAVTSHGVTVEAPGRLRHAGRGSLRVGPFPRHARTEARQQDAVEGRGPRLADARAAERGGSSGIASANRPNPQHGHALQRVLEVLTAGGLAPERVEDTLGHLWLKGAVNAGINPLCALHAMRNGGLRQHWDEAVELVDEIVALSRAAGVRLPDDAVAALAATVEATADNTCSMLQDVEARRPTEVDHITGHFVRVARRLGYPLFANEGIYRRIKALEAAYLGPEAADATMREAARAFSWSDR